jgi:PAS domain-containing protein
MELSGRWSGHRIASPQLVDQLSSLVGRVVAWPIPNGIVDYAGLLVAAILISAFTKRRTNTWDQAIMPPSFVVAFASLLLLGPNAAMLVVVAGAITTGRVKPRGAPPLRGLMLNTAIVMVAMQAAGYGHQWLGGTTGAFLWPWQAVPIAAAVVVFCAVKSAAAEIVVPLFARQPINRSWPHVMLRSCPSHVISASIAVGVAEAIDHQMWEVLPVAAVPLYFVYHAYCAHVDRIDDERRRREVVESLDQGMAVVDGNCTITVWDDVLERILGCPRERALGRSLLDAVPALAGTEVRRAIDDA